MLTLTILLAFLYILPNAVRWLIVALLFWNCAG